MDLKIPLNRLKFGQDDGAGINARVTGRTEGIATLAANLHAQGQIENLIVRDVGDGFYAVANGNKRLAAFHMIYRADSSEPINCTLHDVDETTAFEFSLTTAITAAQLHPIDQYLRERGAVEFEDGWIVLKSGMLDVTAFLMEKIAAAKAEERYADQQRFQEMTRRAAAESAHGLLREALRDALGDRAAEIAAKVAI
jgi:hypothetical protein